MSVFRADRQMLSPAWSPAPARCSALDRRSALARTSAGGSFIAAALVLFAFAAAGHAQQAPSAPETGDPVVLAPPISLVPGGQPRVDSGSGAGGTAVPDSTVPSAAALRDLATGRSSNLSGNLRKKGIEIDSLSDVDPNSIGAIGIDRGGLGPALWRNSERTTISGLLRQMPTRISSPTLRDLLRRTLLTAAQPPETLPSGSGPDASDSLTLLARSVDQAQQSGGDFVVPPDGAGGLSGSFLSLRAEVLAALGETAGLNDLLEVVPDRDVDQGIAQVQVETLMLLADDVTACAIVRDAVATYPQAPFWSKALMYCQIVDGAVDRAVLGLDLLREGGEDDAAFFALVEGAAAAAGGAGREVPVTDPLPLHMSLARATGQRVIPDKIDDVRPAVLAALATATGYDPVRKAEAAEWAVTFGSLPVSGLAGNYGAFSFGDDELQAPIEAAALAGGARGRALLYQAAREHEVPAARAEILNEAYRRMQADGLASVGSRLYLPLLTEIEPSPELIWFGETAGRELYLAGRIEQAEAWVALADRLAPIDPQAKGMLLGLWPYQRLSGARNAGFGIAEWYLQRSDYLADFAENRITEGVDPDSQTGNESALSGQQVLLLRALLGAVGENDDLSWSDLAISASWQMLDENGPDSLSSTQGTDPLVLFALDEASRANRKGESIILATMTAPDPEAAARDLLAISFTVRSLSRLGLDREARALAMEAAQSSGL